MTQPRVIQSLNFDPSPYSRAPILNVASGIALAQALCRATPADAEPAVRAAARHLQTTADAAQAAWAARMQQAGAQALTPDERRRIDLSADRGWSALRAILEAKAGLSPERYTESAPAEELYTRLFVDGTEFLNWPYPEQHAAMDTLLRRIEREDLAGLIDALCGPDLLRYLREVHKDYERMALRPKDDDAGATRSLLPELCDAIVHYALNVCATVKPGDAASARRARTALSPIDTLRAQQAHASTPAAAPVPAPAPAPAPAPGPAAPAGPAPAPAGDTPR